WLLSLPRAIARRPGGLRALPGTIARRTLGLAIARLVVLRPRADGPVLLLEPIALVLVRAARAPVGVAPLAARRRFGERCCRLPLVALEVFLLGLARSPQLAAREPLHRDVRVFSLELVERGEQLVALARAKCGRRAVGQDRPVGVARRHPLILQPVLLTSASNLQGRAICGWADQRRCCAAATR